MLAIPRLAPAFAFALLLACSSGERDGQSSPKDAARPEGMSLAALQYKDNKAVLFAGSGEHKEFMAEVVPVIATWFNEPDVGFTSTNHADLSAGEIMQKIKDAAGSISADGTLALYFLTHGSAQGHMLARDRLFMMNEVVAAIGSAGRTTPLRRLMVFVETCYSGTQVNTLGLTGGAGGSRGGLPADLEDADPWSAALAEGQSGLGLLAAPLYTEALIVTSSKNNQLSNVPIFANALYQSFIDHNYTDDATIEMWLASVKQHTMADAPMPQEPMWKGIPATILQERLWMPVRAPAPGGDGGVPTELLDNTITPDDVGSATEAQSTTDTAVASDYSTGTPTTTGSGIGTGTAAGPGMDNDEEDEDDEDDKDDDDDNGKKKKKKANAQDTRQPSNGCGVTGTASTSASALPMLIPLLAAFAAFIRRRRCES